VSGRAGGETARRGGRLVRGSRRGRPGSHTGRSPYGPRGVSEPRPLPFVHGAKRSASDRRRCFCPAAALRWVRPGSIVALPLLVPRERVGGAHPLACSPTRAGARARPGIVLLGPIVADRSGVRIRGSLDLPRAARARLDPRRDPAVGDAAADRQPLDRRAGAGQGPGVLQASQRLWATLIRFPLTVSAIATGQRSCLMSRRLRTTSDLLLRHRFRRSRR